jgi:fibronectin type 3 domain-containing protein
VVGNGVVILLWALPPDPDVAGYRIFRGEEAGREKQLLQPALVTALSYRDEKAPAGRKYEYFVIAVDTHGNESVPAHAVVEVP